MKTDGDGGRCQPAPDPAPRPSATPLRMRSLVKGSVIGQSWNDVGPAPRPMPRPSGTLDTGSGGPAAASPVPAGLLAGPPSAGRTMRQPLQDDGGWMGGKAAPGAAGLGDLGILYGAAAQGAGGGPSAGSPGRRMQEDGVWVGGAGGNQRLGDLGILYGAAQSPGGAPCADGPGRRLRGDGQSEAEGGSSFEELGSGAGAVIGRLSPTGVFVCGCSL